MQCPKCQHPKTDVLETRESRRRRKCRGCGEIFSTRESVVAKSKPVAVQADPATRAINTAPPAPRREFVKSARKAIEDLFELRSLGLCIDSDDAEAAGLC